MTKKAYMLDLESLGTVADCPILSIGLVEFDKSGVSSDAFYVEIKLEDALHNGRVSADTLRWWITQTDAKNVFTAKKGQVKLTTALLKLKHFIGDSESVIWAKPSAFDIAALDLQYDLMGQPSPWEHWNRRCMKTAMEKGKQINNDQVSAMMDANNFPIIPHDALSDARWQACCMVLAEVCDVG